MGVLARGGGEGVRARARLRQGCLSLTGRVTFARVADLYLACSLTPAGAPKRRR